AQQQGQQGEAKGVVAPPVPGTTTHHHLIGEEIAPCHGHDEAQEEGPQSSWRAAGTLELSTVRVYHRCSSRTIAAPRTMARSLRYATSLGRNFMPQSGATSKRSGDT